MNDPGLGSFIVAGDRRAEGGSGFFTLTGFNGIQKILFERFQSGLYSLVLSVFAIPVLP